MAKATEKITDRLLVPIDAEILDLEGKPILEPEGVDKRTFVKDEAGRPIPLGPDPRPQVPLTLGKLLVIALSVEFAEGKIPEGLTLKVTDKLLLALQIKGIRPLKDGKLYLRYASIEQLKILIKAVWPQSLVYGGQALELLGDEAADL